MLTLSLSIFTATPCGWDQDTLEMELKQFPTIHELITGKFLRHSQELYYWRVKDRTAKIAEHPDSLHWYNDLAVALDKIGEHEKAVETMLTKDKLSPEGYETYANLGTFYIHNGQFEQGLEFIKKAIKINPEAHFGREVYQQYVVEYILTRLDEEGKFTLPLAKNGGKDFYHFLHERHIKRVAHNAQEEEEELAKAIKGIAGMMRFGFYESPVLLECLGSLLTNTKSGYEGAGHLASRAYMKASFEVKDQASQKSYYAIARATREQTFSSHGFPGEEIVGGGSSAYRIEDLQRVLKLEVQAGNAWFDQIRTDEMAWIAAGLNPDSAFAVKYYGAPELDVMGYRQSRNKTDQIDEMQWIIPQLEQQQHIVMIHNVVQLADSTKQLLDSIYLREFASALPEETVVDTLASAPEALPQADEEEEKGPSKLLIFGVMVLVVGGYLIYRDFKKSK
jgi:tetratricopeptide (TPR) repeat protein